MARYPFDDGTDETGPFRVADHHPWDGQPWRLVNPELPGGYAYAPIVEIQGRWFAQMSPLYASSSTIVLIPLTGDEAVAPYRGPASVIAAEPDEGPYYLIYHHNSDRSRQYTARTLPVTITVSDPHGIDLPPGRTR